MDAKQFDANVRLAQEAAADARAAAAEMKDFEDRLRRQAKQPAVPPITLRPRLVSVAGGLEVSYGRA